MSSANGPATPFNYKPPPTPNLGSVRRSGVVVFAWGRADLGQLALQLDSVVSKPTKVEALYGKDVMHISCSAYNTVFLTADGEVYSAGSNDNGQLGAKLQRTSSNAAASASSAAAAAAAAADCSWKPLRVNALDVYKVQHVAAGQSHVLAVTEQGQLASWGAAEFGQLGQGSESLTQPVPRIVKGIKDARMARAASGACHSLALAANGSVYSFGQGTFGALGQGDEENRDTPVLVEPLWPVGVAMVSCGENHSAALSIDGRLFTWGRGKYGQLGLGDFKSAPTPEPVKSLFGEQLVQVACGGDHTLALTQGGTVYSWGRGTWGQCGGGTPDNTCRPGKVQALLEHQVLQIGAGARHSLVLTAANALYAFGDGEQGQLGTGALSAQFTPKKVEGLPSLPILFIAVGGDHSMAVFKELSPGERMALGPSSSRMHGRGYAPLQPLPTLMELCSDVAAAPDSRAHIHTLAVAVEDVFSSPGFLLAGFAVPSSSTSTSAPSASPKAAPAAQLPVGTGAAAARSLAAASSSLAAMPKSRDGPPNIAHNVDVQAVQAVYQALLRVFDSEVVAALGTACIKLLEGVQRHQRAAAAHAEPGKRAAADASNLEWLLPLLLILFLNPLNGESLAIGHSLMALLVDVTLDMPLAAQQLLARWLAALPVELFGGRVVRPLQRHLSGLARMGLRSASRPEVLRAAQVLDLLFDANEHAGAPVPLSEFHNAAVSEAADLREEYMIFAELRHGGRHQALGLTPQSLCQVPFLLTPEAKSKILLGEASAQKQHMVQSSAMSALLQGVQPTIHIAFLDIHVRRSHILHDSLQQIVSRPQDLKKPLRVTFISNGVPEEGIDEGGVSREYFQLLVAEIFKPDYGMFVYSEETRDFGFNPASLESSVEFQLVGIILGLAIYNGVILDVHFPLVVYKKLLGQRTSFADLVEAQPSLARGLQQLLEFEGDVEGTFCRTFEVEYEFYGAVRRHELLPGGSNKPVTASNRQQYVELYTDWLLNKSVEKQFHAFAHGFHQVCGGLALSLFRHDELELLVCGLPHLDFGELERNARYDGGYSPAHPTVVDFWAVVHTFSIEQKRRLLSFATGCDRAPVGGLGQLTLTVQVDHVMERGGPDTDRLPTSHTCYNTLLLPEYSSRAKLRERLLLAIDNAQGFGLR